ncbi:uncharacterized protein [Montipora foliosa]|uniref:uncharacterized protein isoform X1 n=1 Tax=Montipora foliosa TaxID=591990 RepID=UPI0035F11AAA
MDFRVIPSETDLHRTVNYIREGHEMPSFISNHTVVEVFPDASSGAAGRKEEMLMACERIYSPILKSMKLFGMYFGDTSIAKLRDVVSAQDSGAISFSFFYCMVAMASHGLHVVMTVVSLCMVGTSKPVVFFVLLIGLLWGVKAALNATICLVVLPLTKRKSSRFEEFLRNLVDSQTDLNKLKSTSKKILTVSCVVWILTATVTILSLLNVPYIFVGSNEPWFRWNGFLIVSMIIIMFFVCGAWLLPIVFICVTSSLLEHLFDEFSKRILSNHVNSWQIDLAALKEEHRRLCDTSELANKMLSPLFLVFVAAYIPLTCFCFYMSVNPPRDLKGDIDEMPIKVTAIYWLLLTSASVAVILVFGSKVNGKIHSFQAILERAVVPDQEQVKLLTFMFYLNAEPKGLSIGGLVVITKSLCLTIVGIILSYFAVMLSLPT